MSKAKAEIISGVRLSDKDGNSTLFIPGMEDQLAAVITQKEIDHLSGQGVIIGEWTPAKKAAEAPKEPAK